MSEKTEKSRILAGELYRGGDKGLLNERRRAQQLLARYHGARDDGEELRTALLRDFLSAVGEGTVVLPTFFVRLRLQHRSRPERLQLSLHLS